MPYVRRSKRMPKRTNRRYRKRVYKSKKKFGRTGFFKIMRWSSLNSSANCHLQLLGDDTLPNQAGITTFALNNLSGVGEIQSLFDNYRITKVLYRWVLTRDPSADAVTTANRGLFPRINWVHDFNDGTSISRSQMYQHANMKEVFLNENFQKTRWYPLNPACVVKLFETTLNDSYSSKWRQWIDTAEAATPHYGLKYVVDQLYSNMSLRLEAKIMVECKGIS